MPVLSGQDLLARLQAGERFVADGAMGTALIDLGIEPAETLSANITHQDAVRAIHTSYLEAGAQILTSNTFGQAGSADWEMAFLAGIQLAYETADKSKYDIAVLVSMTAQTAINHGLALPMILRRAGFWPCNLLVETCISQNEALEATAVLTHAELPLLAVTCHFSEDGLMPDRTSAEVAALVMAGAGAHVVGANCGSYPANYPDIACEMNAAKATTRSPLLFRPSAGLPTQKPFNSWQYPITPEMFMPIASRLLKAGANIVGGCCGTTPAHIAAVRQCMAYSP